MKKLIWKMLSFIGVLFFLIPIVLGIYKVNFENWNFFDWIIMYSFLYWPTYIIGFILIIISAIVLNIRKKKR